MTGVGSPAARDVGQQRFRGERGRTVSGAAQDGEAADDRAVRVGAIVGGDADRQRRAGQLVIGEQHQRGIDQVHGGGRRRAGGEAVPQPGREAWVGSGGPSRRQRVDQRDEQPAGRQRHRLGPQVVPEGIGAGRARR